MMMMMMMMMMMIIIIIIIIIIKCGTVWWLHIQSGRLVLEYLVWW